mmetsp:Transcript_15410/g.35407  ORF Transcript_15410/g.35407 Transcript_15410/m.35407 type:complete len:141 (-) Transcript_15410:82-504(-)
MPRVHLGGKELYPAFQDCWAPEEAFFPTAMALLGHFSQTIQRSLTYAEWNERARNQQDRAHPKVWDREFDVGLVRAIRNDHGCIVLRKLKLPIPLSKWERVVTMASDDLETTPSSCSPKRRPEPSPEENRTKKARIGTPE